MHAGYLKSILNKHNFLVLEEKVVSKDRAYLPNYSIFTNSRTKH